MLRKILHIVMVLLLLVATTGLTLSMHFCRGKLASISVNYEAKSCCNMKGNCCENKTVHLEVKDDFTSPVYVENSKIVVLNVLFPTVCILNIELFSNNTDEFITYTDLFPPPTIQAKLSLLQTYLC